MSNNKCTCLTGALTRGEGHDSDCAVTLETAEGVRVITDQIMAGLREALAERLGLTEVDAALRMESNDAAFAAHKARMTEALNRDVDQFPEHCGKHETEEGLFFCVYNTVHSQPDADGALADLAFRYALALQRLAQ